MLCPSQRELLAGGLAATVAARAPGGTLHREVHPLLGVQLYSVATEASTDLDGTLNLLAEIGYRTVELAGYMGKSPR